MMPNDPAVSVIIPTYNRAQLVKDAIDSVLSQTYRDFEIIVVDDGSTDNTKEVFVPYKSKIKYIYQENQGVSAARNTGIKHAKGKYIAFLDSDDLWLPHKLEKQVELLDEFEDIALVYSNISYCDSEGRFIRVAFKSSMFASGYIAEEVLLWKVMCGSPPTWLIRKKCFDDVGLFNTSLKMSEDRDMVVRVAMKFKIYGIEEPLTMVRQHVATPRLGRSPAKEREQYYFKFLEKLFKASGNNPIIEKNKKKLIAGYYSYAAKNYLREKNLVLARNRFWLSIFNNPFQLKAYMYFFSTLIGNRGFRVLNRVRKLVLGVSNYYRRFKYNRLSTENGGK